MNILQRIFFVIGGIAVSGYVLAYFLNPTADSLPRNSRMGEWREARVRPACYDAVDNIGDPLLPKLPSGNNHIDFGDFALVVRYTAALNCYIVRERDAICEPNNRAWIVDYMGKYYGTRDRLLAAAARHGDAEISLVKQAISSERNRAIAFTVENDIREGKLAKADFGWSAPKEIKPLLDKYAGARDVCPPQRTAAR
jgi:hypothetical protein